MLGATKARNLARPPKKMLKIGSCQALLLKIPLLLDIVTLPVHPTPPPCATRGTRDMIIGLQADRYGGRVNRHFPKTPVAAPCWNRVGTKLREDPSKVFLGSPCDALVPWALLARESRHFSRLAEWALQHPNGKSHPPGGEEDADTGNKICAAEFGSWLLARHCPGATRTKHLACPAQSRFSLVRGF